MIDIMNVRPHEIARVKRVYVAGPFTGATPWETYQNTIKAELLSAEIWQRCAGNIAVVTPHLNSGNMVGAAPEYAYLVGGFAMVDVCQALFAMESWEESKGTKGEILRAIEQKIPVFFDKEDLVAWVNHGVYRQHICKACQLEMPTDALCYRCPAGLCDSCLVECMKEPRYTSRAVEIYLTQKGLLR